MPNPATGWPGLYRGFLPMMEYQVLKTLTVFTIRLGWYSYKIVVKQTEQEYYNVYLPGIMAAYPEDTYVRT